MATLASQQIKLDDKAVLAFRPAHIIRRYAKDQELSPEEAEIRFVECLKFLVLCGENPDVALAPSALIDEPWHAFVLHTPDYQRFCEERLGRFVHHCPTDRPERQTYLRTLGTYETRFGEPPTKYWPPAKAADCSSGVCQGYCDDGCNCA